ncbi:uncharacterized protein si:ch211-244b2.3 [Esox lucius]|uniref:WWE domain-containing protein n=1 Tax=Esox lucius TaxID=8010 RepID=A0A3P8ZCR5_ESOLU|nr:uncharacterized protein si:ch211-244b2.3 [Esox lucius]
MSLIRGFGNIYREYVEEEEEEEEFSGQKTPIQQSRPARGSHFEWQLYEGQQWLHIDNDHVIETHYCQPGAKGMTIYTSLMGQVYIDFDQIKANHTGIAVRRLTFLAQGQSEDIGWYFKDGRAWCEYGSLGEGNVTASVSSGDVEQQYVLRPQGGFQFTVGRTSYSLDFTAMTQTNLATRVQRNVRRRPKFNSIVSGNISAPRSTTTVTAPPPPSAGCKWEFMGEEGVWTEYQTPRCSLDSAAIERCYQQNPGSQLSFKAGRHSYTLNLSEMCQTNNRFGTKRSVRRTLLSGTQQMSSVGLQYCWQFQDMDGHWKDFVKGSYFCSVSSQDIEAQYQQNPNGTMNFTTMRFKYQLDFSAMTQRNLSTRTTRSIRRQNQ